MLSSSGTDTIFIIIKQKIPLTKQEHLSFLPDEGDHIIYSLFHADRHAGFEPELQKELADLDTLQQFFTEHLEIPRHLWYNIISTY